jgi:general secretion pathway protein G
MLDSQLVRRLRAALATALAPAAAGRRRRSRRGMSLVEVMVVIAIILTLMSVLALGVWSIFSDSKVDTTKLTMSKVSQRVEVYSLRKKKPPTTADGLPAVFGNEKIPQDAWGNEFAYTSPASNGKAFDLVSYGADGQEGGTGNDEDIHWAEQE